MQKLLPLLLLSLTGCIGMIVPRTQISGTLGGQPFKLASPKNSDIGYLSVTVATNGTLMLVLSNLHVVMDPAVITTTAEGQAKLVQAGANAAISVLGAVPKP